MQPKPSNLRRRIGRFNSRAAAFLFEIVPIQIIGALASGPAIAEAIRHYDPWTRERGESIGATTSLLVHGAIDLAWFLLRDTIPGLSWGKRLMGLRVVSWRTGEPARLGARALRNILLALPFFVAVEGIASLFDRTASRRIGDWMAGTCIRHRHDPAGEHGLAIWQVLFGLALFAGSMAAQPVITRWMFDQFY